MMLASMTPLRKRGYRVLDLSTFTSLTCGNSFLKSSNVARRFPAVSEVQTLAGTISSAISRKRKFVVAAAFCA
jgi:hypothetical protein